MEEKNGYKHTGPVSTFFDFVVQVPTSAESYCALTKEARPRERVTTLCIEVIIVAWLYDCVRVLKV